MRNAYGVEVEKYSPSAYPGGVPIPAPYRYIPSVPSEKQGAGRNKYVSKKSGRPKRK